MALSSPTVLITILNWKSPENTLVCLDSIFHSDYPSFEVLVIDNGSENNPEHVFLSRFPRISYIHNDKNLGFAGGSNQGIQFAKQKGVDFVWLVNDDATVESRCLSELVNSARQDPKIGLISPVLHNNSLENRLVYSGGYVNLSNLKRKLADSIEVINNWMTESPESVCIDGTALLINIALVDQIGDFDTGFFSYHEDIDYSIRSSKAGFRNIIVPTAIAYHELRNVKFSETPPHFYFYMARNEFRLWQKHGQKNHGLRKAYLTWGVKRIVGYLNDENLPAAYAAMDGMLNALLGKKTGYENRIKLPISMKKLINKHILRQRQMLK